MIDLDVDSSGVRVSAICLSAPVPRVELSSCRLSDTYLTRFASFPVTESLASKGFFSFWELVLVRGSGSCSYCLVSSSAFALFEDAPTEF